MSQDVTLKYGPGKTPVFRVTLGDDLPELKLKALLTIGQTGATGPQGVPGLDGVVVGAVAADFDTRTAAAAATISSIVNIVRTGGYSTVGDGGGATYKRRVGVPSHAGYFQSADGAYWEIVGTELNALQFGVKADGVTDDTTAAQNAINSTAEVLTWPAGTMLIGAAGLTGASTQVWRGQGQGLTVFKASANPIAEFIYFLSKSNVEITDLTIDWNNKTPGGTNSSLGINSCTNVRVARVTFDHIVRAGIIASNTSKIRIEDCTFNRDALSGSANHGILVSSFAGINSNWRILRNDFVNCGCLLEFVYSWVQDNSVNGFWYGAGFAFTASANTYSNIVQNNIITNGSTLNDADGTRPGGIENWSLHSIFSGNISFNNGGPGITNGGQWCAVSLNLTYGNVGAGIRPTQLDLTYNGKRSAYVGNIAFEPQSPAGNQTYGFDNGVDNVDYQFLVGNVFVNAKTLPARLGSGNYQMHFGPTFDASGAYAGGLIANGGAATSGITVPGAKLGDIVDVSYSSDTQGCKLFAWVNTANSVTYRFENNTGGNVTIAAGTASVGVRKTGSAANF